VGINGLIFSTKPENKDAYANGALGALAFAGVSDAIPQRLRHAGDVGGAEDGAGMNAAQIGQLVARPASRHQVHGDHLLLREDKQTVRLIVVCQSHTHVHSFSSPSERP